MNTLIYWGLIICKIEKKIHWYNEAVSYRNKCVRLDILVKNSKIPIEDQHKTFLRGFYDFYSDFNCRYI